MRGFHGRDYIRELEGGIERGGQCETSPLHSLTTKKALEADAFESGQ
jgi:hypothetical protein